MVRITMMRHGKTVWNQERRIQGQLDSPLLPESFRLAQVRGEDFVSYRFDRVYASTASRAIQTAECVLLGAKQEHVIRRDPRLQEMNMGAMQGMLADEARVHFPQNYEDFLQRPSCFVPVGGGEAYPDVFARVRDFLQTEIHPLFPGRNGDMVDVLIVSHGITIKAFEAVMEHIAEDRFLDFRPISNLECLQYEYDGQQYIRREIAQL